MVVVQLDGDIDAAAARVAGLPDVERVERMGSELSLAVSDGPAAIPVIATALAQVPGVAVREMALRRPTLDDAFLAMTGQAPPMDAAGSEQAGARR
jgi:ABC-2 type transport system ATP-binding protein